LEASPTAILSFISLAVRKQLGALVEIGNLVPVGINAATAFGAFLESGEVASALVSHIATRILPVVWVHLFDIDLMDQLTSKAAVSAATYDELVRPGRCIWKILRLELGLGEGVYDEFGKVAMINFDHKSNAVSHPR
jgi:hypothetical protein